MRHLPRKTARRALVLTVAALAVGLLPAATAGAQPTPPDQAAADVALTYSVQVTDGDAGVVAEQLVAAGYDVAGRDSETIFVLGGLQTGALLAGIGGVTVTGSVPAAPTGAVAEAPASQDDVLPRRLDGTKYPTFYGGYRTVEAYLDYTDDLEQAYPDLVRSLDYGESWSGDHPLRAVCITADARDGCDLDPDTDKPRFLVVAQTHARELTTSELMWRFMTELVDGYDRDGQITGLLEGTEIWIVPQVNPDGIAVVEEGITEQGLGGSSPAWQRKNLNDTYSSSPCAGPWANSQEGVDINRNFDIDWGRTGTSREPCNLTYGGPEAASEVETTAQVDLMQDLYRDRRGAGMGAEAPKGTVGGMLTLHSYSDVVLLPWGFTTEHAPNDEGLRSYAFRMSHFNGYDTGQSGEVLYNSSGATEDWLYADLGVAGYTWEIGPGGGTCSGFFPAYSCQDNFWKLNRKALIYSAEAARRPYVQSLGPTTLQPRSADAGSGKVDISAVADDDAYGSSGVDRPDAQKVVAARVYVGRAPWAGGKPTAMEVLDNGTESRVTATVDRPARRKLAYLQARDADGNWGQITSVWLKP